MQSEAVSALPPLTDQVLVFGATEAIETCASVLRQGYRVLKTTDAAVALMALKRAAPSLLVADLDSCGEAPRICEAAKASYPMPITVLVTTSAPDTVPTVLASCDGVLLKPFAPNLLSARVGRLLRMRSLELRQRSGLVREKLSVQRAKAQHLLERLESVRKGTNLELPNEACPYCAHRGVFSFDHVSHRRAWYACLECKKVWIAHRQEQF